MAEKKHKKHSGDSRDNAPRPDNEKQARAKEEAKEDAGRPDFGGIPDRDLKKNLGCG